MIADSTPFVSPKRSFPPESETVTPVQHRQGGTRTIEGDRNKRVILANCVTNLTLNTPFVENIDNLNKTYVMLHQREVFEDTIRFPNIDAIQTIEVEGFDWVHRGEPEDQSDFNEDAINIESSTLVPAHWGASVEDLHMLGLKDELEMQER